MQAHAPDVERIADDEDTEDDEAFKEQELLRKTQPLSMAPAGWTVCVEQ